VSALLTADDPQGGRTRRSAPPNTTTKAPHTIPTIGIDGSRLTVGERTGTETYTFQLLAALARNYLDDPVVVYLNATSPPSDLPPIGSPVCIPFPRLWTHVRLSWEMQRRPPGVLFVPAHVIPLRHPRSVVTIHDLGYLHHPEAHPRPTRLMLDWTTRWSVRAARRIIAISETTKRDLIAHYRVPPACIQVIPHGVDQQMRPAAPEAVAALRRRYGLPERYVLFVGTVQPRKNLGRLAKAFRQVARENLPHGLVIAGKRGWLAAQVETQIAASGMADRIKMVGYVPSSDLAALYSGADALCFPSLYEGFGLPVLEAMACGTPVIATNRSAVPEVAGGAALLVDPLNSAEIGTAMVRLLTDADLSAALRSRGFQRATTFTWDRTALATIELLREVRDAKD
jgi:glycosyltransferase involved in cell wall biosynthesis